MASRHGSGRSPYESLKQVEAQLAEELARARREQAERPEAGDDGGEEEGPTLLARIRDRLRLWSFPNDRADWDAISRAREHRAGMGAAPAESFGAGLGRWEFIGPRAFDTKWGHYTSGRVNAIAIDPKDSATIYAGAAGGGVWKTIDNGITWRPLSDTWPHLEVSSIAIDPTDSNVIYAGTGDFPGQSRHYFGLMKSTDGGNTFSLLPVGEAAKTSITGIVVDPDDPSILTICGGRGSYSYVWRSTDAGMTWRRVVNVDADWMKLVLGIDDGKGKRAMYVVGWPFGAGVIYRSLDRGATWKELPSPWKKGQEMLSIAASPLFANGVYVAGGTDRKVFGSDDFGNTWNDVSFDLRTDDFEWDQVWYDFDLACGSIGDPPRELVWLGLKHLNFWDQDGSHWSSLNEGHVDLHALAIDPSRPGRGVVIGNDGGVYEQERIATGWDLHSRNSSLGITQCYGGDASAVNANVCLAATQDNGVGSSQVDLRAWNQLFPPSGGDAITGLVNSANDKVQFIEAGVAFHGIGRTGDRWMTKTNITPMTGADVLDPFSMPLAMDAFGARLFWASDFLWMRPEATGMWTGHLGAQRLAGGKDDAVRALAVAETDRWCVYTGSTDGQVWLGQGPDWIWRRIDDGLPVKIITAIAIHPRDRYDILVSVGGTGTGHIWRCRNTTSVTLVWEDVSGTGADALPDLPAVGVARDSALADDRFYAALDTGVFYTEDGGKHWSDITVPYGLPNVQLTALRRVGTDRIYAFTYGRGVWRLKPSINPS